MAELSTVISDFLQKSPPFCVFDGGLATELERRGVNLNDPLYSALCLIDEEMADIVREVHEEYYHAGADVGISASYQATLQGFELRGIDSEKGEELLIKSVRLTIEARDRFWAAYSSQGTGEIQKMRRRKPLVAASLGPYGAFLADGSEYSGDYGENVTKSTLKEFHRRRLEVLSKSGADLLAIETVPSLEEAQAFVELLEESSSPIPAFISFNSLDGTHTCKGDSFEDCAQLVDSSRFVAAIGINCTAPSLIHGLISIASEITSKPVIVYPNTGEAWNGITKEWLPSTGATDDDFVSYVPIWRKAGARLIGGCCRTTPATIRSIRKVLESEEPTHE